VAATPESIASLRRIGELRGGGSSSGRRPSRRSGRRGLPRVPVGKIAVVLVVAGLAALGWLAWRYLAAGVSVQGIRDGEVVTPTALAGREITVSVSGRASAARVRLNGQEIAGVVRDGKTMRFGLPPLVDGPYELTITSDRPPIGHLTTRERFVVDGTPPAMSFATVSPAVPLDHPMVVHGMIGGAVDVEAPGATLTRQGDAVTLSFAVPPAGPVDITATDAAGNSAVATVIVPVRYPKTNGVHVSAKAWADPALKAGILQMIAQKQINAVELDLKDEQGVVGYGSEVQLANEIGAVRASYDLAAAVEELHALKVRVIGRVVAFLDPVLAEAAWARGDAAWVLQTPDGQPFRAHGLFTNYVQPEVRAYNLAIAEEAAKAGVDDILWDYVRRPEGDPATMVVPGLKGRSSEVIGRFLEEGHELLRPLGVYQGACVFGIAATRPQSIAQDLPLMARHVDYLAPMLYPERWGSGEYGVADPQAQPYDIVVRSLVDFQTVATPLGRALVPWLQDFDDRVQYGPYQVVAQMNAAKDRGLTSWLFWNPGTRYSTEGYPVEG
jgi:hypothetical protein